MGDHSAHTAPLVPPMAWSGGLTAGAASNYGGLVLRSLAPGGCIVRLLYFNCAATTHTRWGITDAPLTWVTSSSVCAILDMGPEPVVSTVTRGTTTVNPGTKYGASNIPHWKGLTGATLMLPDGIFLASGQALEVFCAVANVETSFAIMWEEFKAQPISA